MMVNPPAPPPPGPKPPAPGPELAPSKPPGPPWKSKPPGALTSIVPLIVISPLDSRARGKAPSPTNVWPLPTVIELKSNTAMPFETTPVKAVPPVPLRVGFGPVVLNVYVPPAVGNGPTGVKSPGFSGPAPARPAPPTSTASTATDRVTSDNTRLMRRPPSSIAPALSQLNVVEANFLVGRKSKKITTQNETIARLPGGLSEQIAIKSRSSW